jgi:hypothetical protein
MSTIKIGDTVAFRRDVVQRCGQELGLASFRGTVTEITGKWLTMTGTNGSTKVMPSNLMSKVAHNGVILELVS